MNIKNFFFKNLKKHRAVFYICCFFISIVFLLIFNSLYSQHYVTVSIHCDSPSDFKFEYSVQANSSRKGNDFENSPVLYTKEGEITSGKSTFFINLPFKEFTNLSNFKIKFRTKNTDISFNIAGIDVSGSKKTESDISFTVNSSQNTFCSDENRCFINLKERTFYLENTSALKIKPKLFSYVNYPLLVVFFAVIFSIVYFYLPKIVNFFRGDNPRYADIALLLFIIVLAGIPLIKFDYRDKVISQEGRYLEEMPELYLDDGSVNIKLGLDYDKYFNDRFGGRSPLIALKDKIFSVNHVVKHSSADGTIYGIDDDWYFVDGFMNLNFDTEILTREKQNLKKVKEHFDCPVYVLIYPFKSNIYPEAAAPIFKHPENFANDSERIAEFLKDEDNQIYTINLTKAYLDSKNDDPSRLLYYKDDHHQTEYGAFLGIKQIAEAISGRQLPMPEFNMHKGYMDLYCLKPDFTRGISYSRTGLRSYKELKKLKNTYPNLTVTYDYQSKVTIFETENDRIRYYKNDAPMFKKTVLAIGNSYVANTGRMLSYYFENTYQYVFQAGIFAGAPVFDADRYVKTKPDYVVVAYFTNTVLNTLEP